MCEFFNISIPSLNPCLVLTDPRVNDWPLMFSPIPTVAMVAFYLYVVIFLGPRVMANRKPFKLNNVLIVYNAAQVVFSLTMLWEVSNYSIHILPYEMLVFLFPADQLTVTVRGGGDFEWTRYTPEPPLAFYEIPVKHRCQD